MSPAKPRFYVDIETFSGRDLRGTNVYRYSEDPRFQILMMAFAVDDGPVGVALGHDECTALIRDVVASGVFELVAHNAQFERVCFSRALGVEGFLPPEPWDDTMARAGAWGYPQRLAHLGKIVGEDKDEAGTRLINLFCKPDRNGRRVTEDDKPVQWAEFVNYCRQDVETLRAVDRFLAPLPGWEREVWNADQRVNDRGIMVDIQLAQDAVQAARRNEAEYGSELCELLGIENPRSTQQVLSGINKLGEPIGFSLPNLRKETIEERQQALSESLSELPEQYPNRLADAEAAAAPVERAMELRQELAGAAVKKFSAALDGVCRDGRLRGSLQYFGAHTGRWAGRGTQLQNLPREHLASPPEVEAAILDLRLGLGADARTLKALVRSMFFGPFGVLDYSSIEARVIAWLAGEAWALKAFAEGRDIYVETAIRMRVMSPDAAPGTKEFEVGRQKGKVAVLALGYGGGINALRVMGAKGTDEELRRLVFQWRDANPAIVRFWRDCDRSIRRGGPLGAHCSVELVGDDRLLWLPAGRPIAYRGYQWDDANERITFLDPKRYPYRFHTWGGKISENVTQAVARDCLAWSLKEADRQDLQVVAHVHDEMVSEAVVRMTDMQRVMTTIPWAVGLPVDAPIARDTVKLRYAKG